MDGTAIRKLDDFAHGKSALVAEQLRNGTFALDGVDFHFTSHQSGTGTELLFSALLGFVPFTIESQPKREALHAIIMAANQLKSGRFWIDEHHHLRTEYKVMVNGHPTDENIFCHLIGYYQQARPFLRLVGEHL